MTDPYDFAIALTDDERTLAAQIDFKPGGYDGPDKAQENGRCAVRLTRSLLERHAIPDQRWRYFADSEYNVGGRGASNKDIFERNGCRGDELFAHPHFLPYLRYFIYGADLPDRTRLAFKAAVDDCGYVTSSDVVPLGKQARQLARLVGITPHQARDRFFQLALDCGIDVGSATSIRDSAGRT